MPFCEIVRWKEFTSKRINFKKFSAWRSARCVIFFKNLTNIEKRLSKGINVSQFIRQNLGVGKKYFLQRLKKVSKESITVFTIIKWRWYLFSIRLLINPLIYLFFLFPFLINHQFLFDVLAICA